MIWTTARTFTWMALIADYMHAKRRGILPQAVGGANSEECAIQSMTREIAFAPASPPESIFTLIGWHWRR